MRNTRWTIGTLAILGAVAIGCTQEATQTRVHADTSAHDDDKDCKDTGVPARVSIQELGDEMRRLWTDHVAFTRFFLIEAIADLPGASATAERLLRNQDEIGDAIKPFYGDAAGVELTRLLREHIAGAVAVLQAAKAGNDDALAVANAQWYANAEEIAQFLADANPNLSLSALREAMNTHLDQTLEEATARLTGNWDADVRAFDAIVEHILHLADTLTFGIAVQFPDRVKDEPFADEDLHLTMRKLWEDHVIWTRNVIISAIANASCSATLPDLSAALGRLLRNQDDIGNAVRPLVGDAGADQLTALLREHITIAGEILFAAKANDSTKLADAVTRWYANADAIAVLVAGALGLSEVDAKEMMRTHLDQTLDEARHYLVSKFDQSIRDYDHVVRHILMMADTLSGTR
jgi:hypothetical protein